MDLFGRTIRYEKRATKAIQRAETRWDNIEEIIAALEWGLMHDPEIGRLLKDEGIVGFSSLRGVVVPGARSINEPDIDVLYEVEQYQIIILDLTFREAKASYAGHA